jgi:DNA polymerase III epsilon subunit family exonuclease
MPFVSLSKTEFTAIDLETTGLDPITSDIIEIGAVRFNKNGILRTFSQLIKPTKPLKPEHEQALKVSGITPKLLESSLTFDETLIDLELFLADSCLVIQNAEFDLGFLHLEFKKRQKKFPTLPVFCTLNMARKYYPEFKKFGLAHLRKEFAIETYEKTENRRNSHMALDDSFACMKVFLEIMKKLSWEKNTIESIYHKKGFKITDDYLVQNWLF